MVYLKRICTALAIASVVITASTTAVADDQPSDIESEDEYNHQFLREDMQHLTDSMKTLLFLTHENTILSDRWMKRIITELNTMKNIVDNLEHESHSSTTLLPGRELEYFICDLEIARENARKNPPNLEPTVQLINSCKRCHDNP